MSLYVIFNDGSNVKIREVSVLKESEKRYFIDSDDLAIARKQLDKQNMNKYLSGYVFGNDKNEIINIWNKYHKQEIAEKEAQINEHKSLMTDLKAEDLLK